MCVCTAWCMTAVRVSELTRFPEPHPTACTPHACLTLGRTSLCCELVCRDDNACMQVPQLMNQYIFVPAPPGAVPAQQPAFHAILLLLVYVCLLH